MNARILLVDDEADVRLVVRTVLTRSGFHVHEAVDGASARGALAENEFDLMVLDIGLPDVDGCELLRSLRATSGVPVLVLTARSSEHERERAMESGADAFMGKPFSNAALVAALQRLLAEASARQDVER
jgi:DNA-binding response OmpR family regulator